MHSELKVTNALGTFPNRLWGTFCGSKGGKPNKNLNTYFYPVVFAVCLHMNKNRKTIRSDSDCPDVT